MLIYLLRHGETDWNRERRHQGLTDIPLSDRGRAALRQADFAPEQVYVSPLVRARETAAVLFPRAIQIVIPDFREMDFGAFEGRTANEMADGPAYRAWVAKGCTGRCPGGENLAEFSNRVWNAFVKLLETEQERLVIVAHGGVQMAILDCYAEPHRDYFSWTAPCGGGGGAGGGPDVGGTDAVRPGANAVRTCTSSSAVCPGDSLVLAVPGDQGFEGRERQRVPKADLLHPGGGSPGGLPHCGPGHGGAD